MSFWKINGATLTVGGILFILTVLIVIILIRDRKNGKKTCGFACGSCPNRGNCEKPENTKETETDSGETNHE